MIHTDRLPPCLRPRPVIAASESSPTRASYPRARIGPARQAATRMSRASRPVNSPRSTRRRLSAIIPKAIRFRSPGAALQLGMRHLRR